MAGETPSGGGPSAERISAAQGVLELLARNFGDPTPAAGAPEQSGNGPNDKSRATQEAMDFLDSNYGNTASADARIEQTGSRPDDRERTTQDAVDFLASNFGSPAPAAGAPEQSATRPDDRSRAAQEAVDFLNSQFPEASAGNRPADQEAEALLQTALGGGENAAVDQTAVDAQAEGFGAALARHPSGRGRRLFRRATSAVRQAEQRALNQARETIVAHTIHDTVKNLTVFGQKVADLQLDRQILDTTRYILTHKKEIATNAWNYARTHPWEIGTGAGVGSAARWGTRAVVVGLLAGTAPSWMTLLAAASAAGIVGGGATGAVREVLFGQADPSEEKTIILGGLKNGYRKLKLAREDEQKRKEVKKAIIKGAALGFVGGAVASEVIHLFGDLLGSAPHEAIQPSRSPASGGLSQPEAPSAPKPDATVVSKPTVGAAPTVEPTANPTTAPATATATAPAAAPATSPTTAPATATATATATHTPTATATATSTPGVRGATMPESSPTPAAKPTVAATAQSTAAPVAATGGETGADAGGSAAAPDATTGSQQPGVLGSPAVDQHPSTTTGSQPTAASAATRPAVATSSTAETMPAAAVGVSETINLPSGSNSWHEMEGYLRQSLGQEPSGTQVQEAVNRFMAENHISDPRAVHPGEFKVGQVNQYIQELKGGQAAAVPAEAAPPTTEPAPNIGSAEEIANKAAESNSGVDSASFAKGQEAIQGVMETKANEIHNTVVQEVTNQNPNASADDVKAAYDAAYSEWLKSPGGKQQMLEEGTKAIKTQLQVEHNLAEKVTNALNQDHNLFQEVPVGKGVTAGSLMHLGWNVQDAPVMGATIAANYDTLTQMWAEMATHHPDMLPTTHFPVSMSEINHLVDLAKGGDETALRKLRQALHWIPAGSKLRLIIEQQAGSVLDKAA